MGEFKKLRSKKLKESLTFQKAVVKGKKVRKLLEGRSEVRS